jgi:hypothetical protein
MYAEAYFSGVHLFVHYVSVKPTGFRDVTLCRPLLCTDIAEETAVSVINLGE